MGERIRRMDAKQVEKILQKYGFQSPSPSLGKGFRVRVTKVERT